MRNLRLRFIYIHWTQFIGWSRFQYWRAVFTWSVQWKNIRLSQCCFLWRLLWLTNMLKYYTNNVNYTIAVINLFDSIRNSFFFRQNRWDHLDDKIKKKIFRIILRINILQCKEFKVFYSLFSSWKIHDATKYAFNLINDDFLLRNY